MRGIYFLTISLMLSTALWADFDDCKFNFGRMWHNSFQENTSFAGQGLSHLAIWVGDNDTYNGYWEGAMAKAAKANNLTPVFYAYVIAEYGKDQGLKDCDMGTPNHCTGGAKLIRNNWSQILNRYKNYAQGVASDYGTSKTTIWLIEPDYLQYSVTGDNMSNFSQEGGGIPDKDMGGKYFNDIVNTIKQHLPNAKIAVDISPWLNNNLAAWYNNFDKSKVDYLFTSGGRTQGNQARIRSDNNNTVTWAQASQDMGGKKIIADDGYGVGGASNNDYQDWMNLSNIQARINDGVVGITIQEPNSSYTDFAKNNSNISVPCGGSTQPTPSSSSSSVTAPTPRSSSSSVTAPAPNSSSSSVAAPTPSSSSSSVAAPRPSSSSSKPVGGAGEWVAENAQMTNESTNGVNIGSANAWDKERVVTNNLGTVKSGTSYSISFDAYVSRGGASMNVEIEVGSYCKESKSFNQDLSSYTCEFTANKDGDLVLKFTIPAERWETLSIDNFSFSGAEAPNTVIHGQTYTKNLYIKLRGYNSLNMGVSENAKIMVSDILGNRINLNTEHGILDLSALPKGIYLIRCTNKNHIFTKQVLNR